MNKTFVTIFPMARDVHIRKDVGMVPFVLSRDFGFQSTLVCFRNSAIYPVLRSGKCELRLQFLKGRLFGKKYAVIPMLIYLLKYARKTDVLHLYFQSRETFVAACLYKLLHPRGILYLKLDMNSGYLINLFRSGKKQGHLFLWNFFFRKIADLVSCESSEVKRLLEKHYQSLPDKLILLPSGIDAAYFAENNIRPRPYEEKERLILTVGRIGAFQKNHEFLLSVIEKIDLKD